MYLLVVDRQRCRRQVDVPQLPATGSQPDVSAGAARLVEQPRVFPIGGVGNHLHQVGAAQPFRRNVHHTCEGSIGVDDGAFTRNSERAFPHLFNKQTVRGICRLERVDNWPCAALHDDGINLAGANGAQGIFSFRQLAPKALKLGIFTGGHFKP